MLTTGCECPIDVKPENLRAMVETGKSYAGKKGRRTQAVKEPKRRFPNQRTAAEIAAGERRPEFDKAMPWWTGPLPKARIPWPS